jgi:hypothetical protein
MKVFFDKEQTSKTTEILSYFCYNIAISVIYMFINIPIVLMISNILAFFLLSWNYVSTFKLRILAALFIYLILMCIEMAIVIMTGYLKFPVLEQNDYSSVYGILSMKMVSFAVALIINNFKNIRKGRNVPNFYWALIALIPAASLYIIVLLFCAKELTSHQLVISIIFMLLINFSTFFLYDVIMKVMWEQMDKKLLEQQNQYYAKQFSIMKESLQSLKEMKHDWKNHLSAVHSLIQRGEIEKSLLHISEMLQISSQMGQAHTGNIVVDSILNFKLQEVFRNNIEVSLDINIPESLNIPSFDLTVIIGNLIDNAMEAVLKLENNRYINIKMSYDKGRFLCCIMNPFDGTVHKVLNQYRTTKKMSEYHGIGLESIKSTLKKYKGSIEIEHNNVFTVLIMMYVEE